MLETTHVYLRMARTHARTKGKSGSTRPVSADLKFVKAKAKDVEATIVKLAKEDDVKPSMIGIILRDQHGVPSVKALTGKTISQILDENKVLGNVPEDLANLVVRAEKLKKHLGNNSRDVHNKRGLQLVEAKLRRLAKYYKNTGKLADSWSYR